MTKTPEELAEEYIRYDNESAYWTKHAFLAGYQAAKDEYKTKISELEIELENWKHTAIHGDEGL
jgi:hypothetical protein